MAFPIFSKAAYEYGVPVRSSRPFASGNFDQLASDRNAAPFLPVSSFDPGRHIRWTETRRLGVPMGADHRRSQLLPVCPVGGPMERTALSALSGRVGIESPILIFSGAGADDDARRERARSRGKPKKAERPAQLVDESAGQSPV